MSRTRRRNGFARCGTLLLLATLQGLLGCGSLPRILRFDRQLAEVAHSARLAGRIDTEGPSRGTLVAVLAKPGHRPGAGATGLDTYVRLHPGPYQFLVSPGRYKVGAYEDRNRNGLLDPGERTLDFSDAPILELGPGARVAHDVVIARDATSPPDVTQPLNVLGLVARTPREQRRFSLWAWSVQGEVRELGDPAFGPESGVRGLWEAADFVTEGVAGIYFLEPYDPQRVPVLYVHGMSGFPQQFTTLIDALDRERFQPWVYLYPSGMRFEELASHLATLLTRLEIQHDFDELAVVAHSAGGLVARGAILDYREDTERDDVRLLVTLSTPWGGDQRAAGAHQAPLAMPPSFADMSPTSDYLHGLFHTAPSGGERRQLPPEAEFHMLFGFRMDGLSHSANDGSVSVASQARLEAQEEARSIRALNQRHVEILDSPQAVARLHELLEQRFR